MKKNQKTCLEMFWEIKMKKEKINEVFFLDTNGVYRAENLSDERIEKMKSDIDKSFQVNKQLRLKNNKKYVLSTALAISALSLDLWVKVPPQQGLLKNIVVMAITLSSVFCTLWAIKKDSDYNKSQWAMCNIKRELIKEQLKRKKQQEEVENQNEN